jgi:hypothetical protein
MEAGSADVILPPLIIPARAEIQKPYPLDPVMISLGYPL